MIGYTTPERPANKSEMQAFYTKEIEKLLELRGKMALGDMARELGLNKGTLITYLKSMRDAGIVCRKGYQDGKPMWELGEEVEPPKKIGKPVEDLHKYQQSVPARQVGMWRDALVAALFGPARGACA